MTPEARRVPPYAVGKRPIPADCFSRRGLFCHMAAAFRPADCFSRRRLFCPSSAAILPFDRIGRRGPLSSLAAAFIPAVFLLAALCMPARSAGAQTLRFADGLTFNDFFAVKVHFENDEDLTLFDVASFEGDSLPWPDAEGNFGNGRGLGPDEDMKYFFWIRRMGEKGAVTYPLPFRRIREIRYLGPREEKGEKATAKGSLTLGDETMNVRVRISENRLSGWIGDFPPGIPSFVPVHLVLTDDSEQRVFLKTDDFLGGIDEEFGTYALLWLKSDGILGLEFLHDGTYSRCPECGAVFYNSELETCPFDGTGLVPSEPRVNPSQSE